jgi:hypothetical protein
MPSGTFSGHIHAILAAVKGVAGREGDALRHRSVG